MKRARQTLFLAIGLQFVSLTVADSAAAKSRVTPALAFKKASAPFRTPIGIPARNSIPFTVLGKQGVYEQQARRTGARSFQVPEPVFNARTAQESDRNTSLDKNWVANRAFLDKRAQRGDTFQITRMPWPKDSPRSGTPLRSATAAADGAYKQELLHLWKKGFKPTADGTMVPASRSAPRLPLP